MVSWRAKAKSSRGSRAATRCFLAARERKWKRCAQAGIEFEVIPGVTAALGAAASAQISLTDRRHASRVVFVTAHREGGTGLTQ